MRLVFFDLETRKHAKELHPNIDAGWEALRRGEGGISALAVYDSVEDWVFHYDDHTIRNAAAHLESADVVIGFRTEGFDIPCVEGVLGRSLTLKCHHDLYVEAVRAAANRGIIGTKGDFTLDTLSRLNLGRGKVDHGEHAPELARRGQWAKLFYYCCDDVRLTRDLFRVIRRTGHLRIVSGRTLKLDIPDWIKES